jgi:adenosylmethionine-8-amino-7-oxononanoate aminotransferase
MGPQSPAGNPNWSFLFREPNSVVKHRAKSERPHRQLLSTVVLPAFLHPFARPTKDDFVTIVRGEGARVYDSTGKGYVDGMASLWYCNVGHGRTEIADAIRAQASTLAAYSTFDPFTNEPADRLADRLTGISPMPGARVFFTDSGSESVDTAIKLARVTHQLAGDHDRTMIISRNRGYHGVAYGGTSAQGIPPNREGWGPLVEGVVQVPADDVEALAGFFAEHGSRIAAFITEPVQGAGGVYPPDPGYLETVRRLCDQHGALLIFDEVITGYGRLGSWFAAHHFGVTPDLTTFAKGITSGYVPLGGVFVGARVREALEADPAYILRHGFTYSGHPTACAAAHANLDILEREGLVERASAVGQRLGSGLQALAADGVLAGVRGVGAIWSVQVPEGHEANDVRIRLLELGVISRAIGTDTLPFCPPFVATDADIDQIVDALATALG